MNYVDYDTFNTTVNVIDEYITTNINNIHILDAQMTLLATLIWILSFGIVNVGLVLSFILYKMMDTHTATVDKWLTFFGISIINTVTSYAYISFHVMDSLSSFYWSCSIQHAISVIMWWIVIIRLIKECCCKPSANLNDVSSPMEP